MKKMKRVLIGALLVFTLCMLTACGNDNNAADEVPNNTNEDTMDNVGDGTAVDDNMVDDAGNGNDNNANDTNNGNVNGDTATPDNNCLLYTSPSPRD